MRRKVVASILALVVCALMVLPQVGLTVRDAAGGQETVGELPAEDSSQEAVAQESVVDQEAVGESAADAPSPPAESMVPDDAADLPVPEETPAVTAAPEDAPADDQTADVPATEATPEAGEEPPAEEKPEGGELPTEETGSGVYTMSEVESIIGDGISLAGLQELMQISLDSGKAVSHDYFKFVLSDLTGYGTKSYPNYSDLQNNSNGYDVSDWNGGVSGDVTAEMFPKVGKMAFDGLYLNGTVIKSVGVVTVKVQGETGDLTDKDYVWFSPTDSGVSADAMVLPDSVDDTHVFEVRYVYATYNIKYEVYLDT